VIPFSVKPIAIPAVITGDVSPVKPINATNPAPNATQSDPPVFIPGQRYAARVEERLANGFSTVSIAGKLLHMRLPTSAKPGSQLELTLVAQSPRLKFLLHSNMPGNDNPATVSSIGRFITQLLSQVKPSSAHAANNTTPLMLAAPQANSTEAPRLLQQALTHSGLFYEAHLAQWINGKKSLQQIRQAPQGKLPPATSITSTGTSLPISGQTLPLIQQQLHVLETGLIQWRGEIWPNQPMEWDITEQYPEQADEEKIDALPRWQTRIRLQLPNLGEITATLAVGPEGVWIRLIPSADDVTVYLKKNQSTLASAINSAGLAVHAMEIQQDDES